MVDVKNLTLKIGNKEILRNTNFHAEKGQGIYVLGKNGTGKSTFFKLLNKEIKCDKGEININGSIAYLKQKTVLLRNMTVNENYSSFKYLYDSNTTKEEDERTFKNLDIDRIKNTVVEKLSGGELQRMYLSTIYLRNKDIYLLDETDSALDSEGRSMFFNIIDNIKKQGKTVIWISHHIKESLKGADMIYIFHDMKCYPIKKDEITEEMLNYAEEALLNTIIEGLGVNDKIS